MLGGEGLLLARPNFDLVLASSHPEEAADFYADVLDAKSCEAQGPGLGLRVGQQTIEIREADDVAPRPPAGIYDAIGYRVIAVFVQGIDRICEAIEARGRRVAPGISLPGRLTIRFAKDADGNMLEMIGLPSDAVALPVSPVQVGLTVRNAERTRNFYARQLGFPQQPSTPIADGISREAVSIGEATLKYWQPLPVPAARRASDGPGIEAISLRVRAGRGSWEKGPNSWDHAAKAFVMADPDGNRIELREVSEEAPA